MGLSLKMDLGGPSIAFSYGSFNGEKKPDGGGDSTKDTDTGMGLSFSMPMGSDSVVASYTSVTQKTETGSTTSTNASGNGIEVGYNTSLGPVAVSIGYGTQTFKADDGSFSNAAAIPVLRLWARARQVAVHQDNRPTTEIQQSRHQVQHR